MLNQLIQSSDELSQNMKEVVEALNVVEPMRNFCAVEIIYQYSIKSREMS